MESQKGGKIHTKKEHQSEQFDVARLKVREQLTKKGKVCFWEWIFYQTTGQGQGQNLRGKYIEKWRRGQKYKSYLKKKMRTENFSFWNNKLVQQFHFSTFSEMLWNIMRGRKISEIIENFYNIFLSDVQMVQTFTFLTSILLSKVPHFSLEDEKSIYVIQKTSVMLYCTHS